MKLKTIAIILTLAVASLAQTAAPPTPAPDVPTCACCDHDKAAPGCCKDGKCPMMSGSHAGMKCPMMAKNGKPADGKMCCSSNQCPMHAKGGHGNGCCCANHNEQKQPGI